MHASASQLAKSIGLSNEQQNQLNELGTYINYNGYGQQVSDLHFHPAKLFELLSHYPDPYVLIAEPESIFSELKMAYLADMKKAQAAETLIDNDLVNTILLDDESWARRISGVFGNMLANEAPDKAHIIVTLNQVNEDRQASYTVSLRAPLNNKQGAGDICAQFPTGGGRAAAAGINVLPKEHLAEFIKQVEAYYQH
jgi:hypothetical protein